MKKTIKNNKTMKKTIRKITLEEEDIASESCWGKNKPLEKFWRDLSVGKNIVVVRKNGTYVITKLEKANSKKWKDQYDSFDQDKDVVAVLTSPMSTDAYQRHLYPKAKDKSVDYVIKNYKKFFKSGGKMPQDLIEKGFPEMKKVLNPY